MENKKKKQEVEETVQTTTVEEQPLITVYSFLAIKNITGVSLARMQQHIKNYNLGAEHKTFEEWEQEYSRS